MFSLTKYLRMSNADVQPPRSPENDAERIRVATCALLLEVAMSDEEFCESEQDAILAALQQSFDLTDVNASELMYMAERRRQESIDLWQFTSFIMKNYSEDEKVKVIEAIWKVIYADDKLDPHEDYLVHKLSQLLGLGHQATY